MNSDAFKQKFTSYPTQVNGIANLFCMEIESNPMTGMQIQGFNNGLDFKKFLSVPGLSEETGNKLNDLIGNLSTSIPGIDEALSFSELMKEVQEMKYDVVVFDTAPTGHTLRLLSFPSMLENSFDSLSGIGSSFGGMFNQVTIRPLCVIVDFFFIGRRRSEAGRSYGQDEHSQGKHPQGLRAFQEPARNDLCVCVHS